jgi:hypothetical protein
MSDTPASVHVKIGIARFPDGWNVVVEYNGQPRVYDPTFATEAEAEERARDAALVLRQFGATETPRKDPHV